MNSAIERLLTLRVRDVMNKQVVSIAAQQSLSAAAETLIQHEITGLPVVDERGDCQGVLSGTDFVRRLRSVRKGAADDKSSASERPGTLEANFDAATVVRDVMTPLVRSISPDASLMEAARAMCEHHVHRLIVMEGTQRPKGIISSLDVVAAMIQAIEE
jgi:CBS domain-containing protein